MDSAESRRASAHVRHDGLIGVLEVEPTGHRLQYLNHLLEAAGPQRCVVLTSEQAMGSEEFGMHAASVAMAQTIVISHAASRRDVLASAVSRAVEAGVRRLVIPDGDLYLLPLPQLMLRRPRLPMEIRLLLMRTTVVGGPEPLRPAMIVKPALAQALRLFPQLRILFLTDALGVVDSRRGYFGVRPVQDPVARNGNGVANRPAWFPAAEPATSLVGVFGVVSARKNLPLLVEAVKSTPVVSIVVGGRLEPDVRAFLQSDAARALIDTQRMTVADRMLSPDEFSAALSAVDIVAVLHDNDSPSGILAEACIRQTPVLVPAGGWLARVVAETGVGVATELDPHAVTAGIQALIHGRDRFVEATRRQADRIDTADFTVQLLT